MDGVCLIKSKYLVKDIREDCEIVEKNNVVNDDMPDEPEAAAETNDGEDEPTTKKAKFSDKKYKKKFKGQNKSRKIPFKVSKLDKLCSSLFNGNNNEKKCTYEKCTFLHDLDAYLANKPIDIKDHCYIYSTKGFCSRGVTCRFAKHHLDVNNNNIYADNYDEDKLKSTTFNQLPLEMQIKLRKRQYNFNKSKQIVDELTNARKQKTCSVPISSKIAGSTIDSKPFGYSSDSDLIKDRLTEIKRIDFSNKLFLSPLTTVGNLPFRRICKEYGADITCGEMACSVPIINGLGQEWALTKRHVSEDIFGIQLCGNSAHILTCASQVIKENCNVDFIDLNLGCPIELIYSQGGGSALLRRQNVLETIIRSCSRILDPIPFTVKTRTGVYTNKNVAHEFIPKFEEWGAACITVHGRSREQRYTRNADWKYIEECASKAKSIPITGNGDILNFEDYNLAKEIAPSISSVMIGRGALIKPWIFKEIKEQKPWDPSSSERFDMIQKYINYGLDHWGSDTKGVENTRRFFLEWQSFMYRYVPYGLLEQPPQKINQRPDRYFGRDDLETLMASPKSSDWIKLSEMFLGPVPDGFNFLPKHKANAF